VDGPRLTEERLRNHLDSNQVMRERMCLALLPLLGQYTREQSRRPKGGPDGGRDMEALLEGQILIWGAVGFKNGGGSDNSSRAEIQNKFKDDLRRALEENPDLSGFVFFTNVDLTPFDKNKLVTYAQTQGISFIDIFDLERLRHVLDTPEGLIPRLQYLNIPMTPTEQIALVSKFGTQLQYAITTRFDRVEKTLSEMQRFLNFQKRLFQLDAYFDLNEDLTSKVIGDEAILMEFRGLIGGIDSKFYWLFVNQPNEEEWPTSSYVLLSYVWFDKGDVEVFDMHRSICYTPRCISFVRGLSITKDSQLIRMIDWHNISLSAYCTDGFHSLISHITFNVNRYELFSCATDGIYSFNKGVLTWPKHLPYAADDHTWMQLLYTKERNMVQSPPERSVRGEGTDKTG
jgi:hypothetical protein